MLSPIYCDERLSENDMTFACPLHCLECVNF